MSQDVVGKVFEIGDDPYGTVAMQTWISAQVTGGLAAKVLATASYSEQDRTYLVVLMATTMGKTGTTQTIGNTVVTGQFRIRNGIADLLTWFNAQDVAGNRWLHHFNLIERYGDQLLTVTVSN